MSLIARYRKHRQQLTDPLPPQQLHQQMSAWFRSPLGAALIAEEQRCLKPSIDRVFGYHMLQLGCSLDDGLLDDCPAAFKVRFNPVFSEQHQIAVADNEALPLASESMDAVLIHHALDFTPDSHRLLREAERVLMAGGRLMIIGFNPISSWGLSRALRWRREAPWNGRFISRLRLSDWLKLLDFHIDDVRYGGHLLPWGSPRTRLAPAQENHLRRWAKHMARPLGGFYLLEATKRSVPITPVRNRWPSLRAPVMGAPVAEAGRVSAGDNAARRSAKICKFPDRRRK
jgi:SAM-dependent methyltransferase